jgi:LEA14-like dessication related protein
MRVSRTLSRWRKVGSRLPILALPLLISSLLGSCASVLKGMARPSARIQGVRLQDITLQDLTLLVDIEVTNPASVPLPLLDAAYELSSQGISFLSGKAALQGTVPAGGSKVETLPLRLTYAAVLNVLSGVRPGAIVPLSARLTLSVDAPVLGRLELPLERDAELPVPAVPDVRLERIEWSELSLQRATAVLHLGLTNRNSFPVELRELDYTLRLDGTQIVTSQARPGADFAAGVKGQVRIPVSFSPVALGAGVYRLLTGSAARYNLSGTLQLGSRFGSMQLPLDASGNVPLVH